MAVDEGRRCRWGVPGTPGRGAVGPRTGYAKQRRAGGRAVRAWALLSTLLVSACDAGTITGPDAGPSDAGPPDASTRDAGHGDAGPTPARPQLRIGIPDAATGIRYAPLAADGDLQLATRGQGGYHATFVLRSTGLGLKAFYTVTVRDLETGNAVETAPQRTPRLWACDDLSAPRTCTSSAIIVMTSGLGPIAALDGMHVEVIATAATGDGASAEARTQAYLRLASRGDADADM